MEATRRDELDGHGPKHTTKDEERDTNTGTQRKWKTRAKFKAMMDRSLAITAEGRDCSFWFRSAGGWKSLPDVGAQVFYPMSRLSHCVASGKRTCP